MEMLLVNHLAEKGKFNAEQLLNLGREMFIVDQIKGIAANKIKGLRMVDEVEVHLAYQTGLKDALKMNLGNETMLYQACSQVEPKDIEHAANHIQSQLDTPGVLPNFLSQWTPMRSHIQREHANQWQAIEDKYDSLANTAYDDQDWKKLESVGTERTSAFEHFCQQKIQQLLSKNMSASTSSQ